MTDYVQLTRAAIDAATEGITPAGLVRHPEGKWCAAEVLEHLGLTYSGTTQSLETVLRSGYPGEISKSLVQHFFSFVVIGVGHLPAGRKAPSMTLPANLTPDKALDTTRRNLEEMGVALALCAEKFGTQRKLNNHPILGAFNIADWRRFHYVHTRHHMKQIQCLRSLA